MDNGTHGSIGKFRNIQEDWQSYVERLQQYFVANDVKSADKQCAVLLSCVGGATCTHQLIRNLLASDKQPDKLFTEIIEMLECHHQPKPSVIVQRFNFHCRSRHSGGECIHLRCRAAKAHKALQLRGYSRRHVVWPTRLRYQWPTDFTPSAIWIDINIFKSFICRLNQCHKTPTT